jgi:hypothetical protein
MPAMRVISTSSPSIRHPILRAINDNFMIFALS